MINQLGNFTIPQSASIECTFLGHQSWIVQHGQTTLFVDPVLHEYFGHSENIEFKVYPPRKLDHTKMPIPDAVILSHEHLDHFHLPSLDLLPRHIPIYVSTVMPLCVIDAIKNIGFNVKVVLFDQPVQIGDLKFILFPCGEDTVFWELRVSQVFVQSMHDFNNSVFIAVDALISEDYKEKISTGELPAPRAVIVANNSQTPPPGAFVSYTNLLPISGSGKMSMEHPGIELIYSICKSYFEGMPKVEHIILCGNGFVNYAESFGAFLYSDHKELADLMNRLSIESKVHGPYPGECLSITGSSVSAHASDWITLDEQKFNALKKALTDFMEKPSPIDFKPVLSQMDRSVDENVALKVLEFELQYIAQHFMRSKAGRRAVLTNQYLMGALGPHRALFQFKTESKIFNYAFNIQSASFQRVDVEEEAKLMQYPTGVIMYLSDFLAVLDGRLQIWDLAGNAMRNWYLGDMYENIVSFLFEIYGEQVRPDLASKCYNLAIDRMHKDGMTRNASFSVEA